MSRETKQQGDRQTGSETDQRVERRTDVLTDRHIDRQKYLVFGARRAQGVITSIFIFDS